VVQLRVAAAELLDPDREQQGPDLVDRPDRRDVAQPRPVRLVERRHLQHPLDDVLTGAHRPALLRLVVIHVVDEALVDLVKAALERGLAVREITQLRLQARTVLALSRLVEELVRELPGGRQESVEGIQVEHDVEVVAVAQPRIRVAGAHGHLAGAKVRKASLYTPFGGG
jgi:hypothetical protein